MLAANGSVGGMVFGGVGGEAMDWVTELVWTSWVSLGGMLGGAVTGDVGVEHTIGESKGGERGEDRIGEERIECRTNCPRLAG